MSIDQLSRMTVEERLSAMEVLWESLADEADSLESPRWHEAILEERLNADPAGENQGLSLEELAVRLRV